MLTRRSETRDTHSQPGAFSPNLARWGNPPLSAATAATAVAKPAAARKTSAPLKGLSFEGRPVWVEVSTAALLNNVRSIHRRIGAHRKILAIVKGNAYGHGAVEVSRVLSRAAAHVDWLGVTCTTEGIELREAGIRKPILLLTGAWPGEERRALEHNLIPAVTRIDHLARLDRAAAKFFSRAKSRRDPLGIFLKIDTGMNRLGISPAEIADFARALAACRHLKLLSTFTHFASSENFTSPQTDEQARVFHSCIAQLRGLGVNPGLLHLANSAAITSRPGTWADMVRPGAVLYGYHQNYDPPEKRAEFEPLMPLRPALSLRARIISLRDIAPGEGVGYNARFRASRPSRIAVIAAGYADGIPREWGRMGRAIVRGQYVPLVGIVSMDLVTLDVSDLPDVQLGDVCTLYGSDGSATLTVADVARELGTVSSHLLTQIGKRVPRFFL